VQKGVTLWFTGLSGAGKTTICKEVEKRLRAKGVRVERLDGDVVRQSLTRDLGFTKEDRDKNIERVTFVAKLLTRNDVIVLAAFISPYRKTRDYSRQEIGEFIEVYVKASLDTCIRRDVKGLYKKALAGEIDNFTGVSDPYEDPVNPELVLDTEKETVEESTGKVIACLEERGYIGQSIEVRPTGEKPRASQPALIKPHGGDLVNLEVSADEASALLEEAEGLTRINLLPHQAADVEMMAVGAMSPLTGFMVRADYQSVVESMYLSNGVLWPLPVTLSVDDDVAARIDEGDRILLTSDTGLLAIVEVRDKYRYDKYKEAVNVYRTDDGKHPGVARLYSQGDTLIGGPVKLLRRASEPPFADYRLDPAQTRAVFAQKGWKRVVGFQTRNPIHRAHEYVQKCALETMDGLLIHPLVGPTKAGDIPADVRMLSYKVILDEYYPPGRVFLSVFPAAMRYAGPREAIFHAICRQNYGCTHFIVGRDHAGVGAYYGTYDAQLIFDELQPGDLAVTPMFFEHAFYCRACGNMATAKTCPHDESEHVFLSGTKVRALLRAGELPPPEMTRPEVARILMAGSAGEEESPGRGSAASEQVAASDQ